MSNHFHAITTRHIRLGMAIKILDHFTSDAPISTPEVLLDGEPVRAYGNLQTGYWSVPDKEFGEWTLEVRARFYFTSEPQRIVIQPHIQKDTDPEGIEVTRPNRRFEVTLYPRPDYPFPEGTMIRGLVSCEAAEPGLRIPLAGVLVEASYEPLELAEPVLKQTTVTDNRGRYDGRYALFLNVHKKDRYQATLTFAKEGYQTTQKTVEVRYNQTVFCNAILEKVI